MNYRVTHEESLEENLYLPVAMKVGELFIDIEKQSTHGGHR